MKDRIRLGTRGSQLAMTQTLDRLVIQIAVRDFQRRRQTLFLDREAVVLTSDLH